MRRASLAGGLALLGGGLLVAAVALTDLTGIGGSRPEGSARAEQWLLSRQSEDGSFRSTDYAVLRAGRSTTAVVLRALVLSESAPSAERLRQVERGFEFLDGQPFDAAPVDYPAWTAALTLQALGASNRLDRHRELARRAVAFLRAVQLIESNGWAADRPEHGGFGLGDGPPRAPDGAELLSLATTSAAIEGLVVAGVSRDDPMLVAARGFVLRCQDLCGEGGALGGFAFTTAPVHARSKAGLDDRGCPLPIGTTTADGLRALRVLDDPRDAARRTAAEEWLRERFSAERVPGFRAEQQHLEAALRIYWSEAASRVVDGSSEQGRRLSAALCGRQRADGSIVGDSAAMKEDDPLVATALVVTAWARLTAADGR